MKFTAENMGKLYQKGRKKLVKKSIVDVKNKIKQLSKDGTRTCTIEFYDSYSEDEQKIISNFFSKKGFKIDWIFDNKIRIKWV